ncbi:MAG TPA: chemotaxis protein CheB [Polyangiaceae bacterium]|nr:chemotaxis protein CheB [Polyangiaceae bacterium]
MSKHIVVVGTSLGGLNALTILLAGLPRDFPAPIAIAQHRTRDADSSLAELLQRQSALPVVEADDKTPIEAGRVYLAPPDYHLLVGAEELSLSTEAPVSHARPSIDVLFDSAASSFGTGVIAVILTGASEDGAQGAAVVKRRGGRVIVQDPNEAESAIMPLAVVNRKLADAVLPLRAIPLELQQIARR